MIKEQETACEQPCPVREACRKRVSSEEARLAIHPGLPAEHICADALKGIYKNRRVGAFQERIQTTFYFLEMGLSHVDCRKSEDFFRAAAEMIDGLTEGDFPNDFRGVEVRYPELKIIQAELPLFWERRMYGGVCDETINKTHKAWVDLLTQKPKRNGPRSRLRLPLKEWQRTELEMACLLTRLEDPKLVPFWAFAREERNQTRSSLNHDWYLMINNNKVPVQIKTVNHENNNRYDPSILVLVQEELKGCVDNPQDVCMVGLVNC